MDYQDFVLQLDRAPGEQGFLSRVIRSPAGEAEAPFVNPIAPQELTGLWQAALDARRAERGARDLGSSARPTPANSSSSAELQLEDLGDRLFKALFRGPVRNCWMRSLAESGASRDSGLRLKLQLNLADSLLVPLSELPWEYLFSPEDGGFLALQRRTPILRHLRLPLPVGLPPVAQPLRLLIVSSQPRSLPPLALQDEGKRIADALGSLPGVETVSLHNPTVEDLREALLRRNFHVLHFMGHGGFDPFSGQGVLYFADREGALVPVSGSLLASHLADLATLRLVFVNACETARAETQAPFAGVATALMRAGLTAVVAMQRPISDGSALEFSRTVYRRLATGDPIDAAVTEGRLAIARGQGSLPEWGTPVLFLRADDGRIFAPKTAAAAGETPMPVSPKAQEPPDSSRAHRPLVSFVLSAVLAIILGIVVARWFGNPQMKPEFSLAHKNPITTEQSSADSTPHPEPTAPPARITSPEKPSPAKEEKRQVSPETHTVSAAPSVTPRQGLPYAVSEGNPASIPDLEVEVGARFFERDGYKLARFWITPPDGEMMQQEGALLNPKSIDFPSPKGTYHLDVLSLDMAGKRATVRLRLRVSPAT